MGKATKEGRQLHEEALKEDALKKTERIKAIEEIKKINGFRYAVMRAGQSQMRFSAVYEKIEEAEESAIRLMTKSISEGQDKVIFSVIKIEKSYGFENGKFFNID